MEPPPPPLGTDARTLLDAAKRGIGPDAAAIARMRAAIGVQLGIPATASSVGPTAVTSSGAGHALAMKLGATMAVAALAIGIALYRGRGVERTTAIASAMTMSPTPASASASASAPAPAPALSSPSPGAPPKPSSPIRARPVLAAPPPPPAVAPKAKHRADLAREVELIDRAMSALESGDPRSALAAVRTHAQETAGAGQLAEDAAAIEIEALCASDATVTTKLAAFDARWPHSAQRHRLTIACHP